MRLFLLLFGNGVSSITDWVFFFIRFLLWQFPLTGSRAAHPWTLRETVLSRSCLAEGFSLRPPQALCLPKKHSRGSCVSLSLKRYCTLGCLNKYSAISIKECIVEMKWHIMCDQWLINIIHACLNLPVIFSPVRVSLLRHIICFWAVVNPSLCSTLLCMPFIKVSQKIFLEPLHAMQIW